MNFSNLEDEYDVIVAGGGITGAGVYYEAVKRGYKTLLLEAKDFAWGTSSRSSKMVHGGLRYLKQGKFLLTRQAVKQRELLLKQYPGLVTPLKYIMPLFDHYGPSMFAMKAGLSIYSLMAGETQHEIYTKNQAIQTINEIGRVRQENLVAAVGFKDAQVDDARLVLRLIDKGNLLGGMALNYIKVVGVERDKKGCVAAVNIRDEESGLTCEIKTKVLINATGVFAEELHASPEKGFHIRPLRGSHLIFPHISSHIDPQGKFALDQVLSFIHPKDLRPVFLFPWEGSTVLGTTDVDHYQDIKTEPFVTMEEADYLMEGLKYVLPDINLSLNDCTSTIAGVRPILSKKNRAASKESREHVVWKDRGLITITGGKLTTFQLLAKDALKAAKPYLPNATTLITDQKAKHHHRDIIWSNNVSGELQERLIGRYGKDGCQKISQYDATLFTPIEKTKTVWAEILYAAEHENICHLSDLLLRRVRVGLFLHKGGINILDKVEALCKPHLNRYKTSGNDKSQHSLNWNNLNRNITKWDDQRWEMEKKDYLKLWKTFYSPYFNRKQEV